jgi:hypothetical protein
MPTATPVPPTATPVPPTTASTPGQGLDAPSNLKVFYNYRGTIGLYWSTVDDAEGYEIWCKLNNGTFNKIDTTSTYYYYDYPGRYQDLQYYVIAYKGVSRSSKSNTVSTST